MGKLQMLPDQKLQPFAILPRKPQPAGNCRDHGGALLGMSPSGAFADIMKQHRQNQQFRFADLGCDRTGKRHYFLKLAAQHLLYLLHGKKRMYIDSIDMIKVVLNLAVDMLQFRYKAVQKLQVMHLAQCLSNSFGGAEYVQKGMVDLTIAAKFVIDQ